MNIELVAEKSVAIALHSMCQPGRPRSPGLSHPNASVIFVPRFPEREIAHVFFVVFVVLYPSGRSQLRQVEVGEFAVGRELVDPKID